MGPCSHPVCDGIVLRKRWKSSRDELADWNCSCVRVTQAVMTGEWEDEDAQEVLQLGMGDCTQIDAKICQTFPGSQINCAGSSGGDDGRVGG